MFSRESRSSSDTDSRVRDVNLVDPSLGPRWCVTDALTLSMDPLAIRRTRV